MKGRVQWIVFLSGLLGLLTNALAILGYLGREKPFAAWRPDRGMLALITLVMLVYGLSIWSALVWRWTRGRAQPSLPAPRRAATPLLNGLAAFPFLALWLYLLFSMVLYSELGDTQRWLITLAHTAMMDVPLAIGLSAVGEVLGPLLASDPAS
jgi:heme/copper-type cytochrome/quinol oxidase subunit 2